MGKWLVRVKCDYVDYCWDRVRRATEEGTLGIAAKVATDWGNKNDPAAPGARWRNHVICVYTYDWRDQHDVLRVAKRLNEMDAVRRQVLYYKPDAMTYGGVYSENMGGDVAIYETKPPYDQLIAREEGLALLEQTLVLLNKLRETGRLAI